MFTLSVLASMKTTRTLVGRATTIANFVNSEPQGDTCGHCKVYSFLVMFICLPDGFAQFSFF